MGHVLAPAKPNLVKACGDIHTLDWDLCLEMSDIRVPAYFKWSSPSRCLMFIVADHQDALLCKEKKNDDMHFTS